MAFRVSAILLAAGLSRRMGGDKLCLSYQGETLISRAVNLLSKLPVFEKILVATPERLETLIMPPDIRAVVNPTPDMGISGSLRLGLEPATGDWYFFMTADQPCLTVEDLAPLLESTASGKNNAIIYPVVNGNPCSPSLFSSCYREELLTLSGDSGGRVVRDMHPRACTGFTPKHPKNFLDVDNAEDYVNLCL